MSAVPPAAPGDELSPLERLARSRAKLRRAWLGPPSKRSGRTAAPPRDGPGPDAHAAGTAPADAADESPIDVLASMLGRWWHDHPLHQAADMAHDVAAPIARDVLTPIAQRHPLRLVAVAAGAGALVVALRPWRWLPQAALSSILLSAVLPRGGLMGWLRGGGLMNWLASGDFGRLLATLNRHPGDPGDEVPAPAGAHADRARSAAADASAAPAASPATAAPTVPPAPGEGEPASSTPGAPAADAPLSATRH